MTHFHPPSRSLGKGVSPCGKRLNLCNWSTGWTAVTCKKCLAALLGDAA